MGIDVERTIQSGIEHQRTGRSDEAERLYRSILTEHPRQPDALYLLGALAIQNNKPAEAVDWISRAIAARPTAEYYFDLAYALAAVGEHERAIGAVRDAIALKPNVSTFHGYLASLLQGAGRSDEAIGSLSEAISLEPTNPEWHHSLGNALLTNDHNAEAVECFKRCLALSPNHVGALNNLGSALHRLGRFDEAIASIQRALRINPRLVPAWFALADVFITQRRFEEAAQIYSRIISVEPQSPNAYNDLGYALWEMRRYTEAIRAFRRGLALHPQWPESLSNLSAVLTEVGDYDEAIAAAQQALKFAPQLYLAREAMANAMRYRDIDTALAIQEKLVAERPDDDRLWNSYAYTLRLAGRNSEALEGFRRAAELGSNDHKAASNYLFSLQFECDDWKFILAEHRKFEARYAAPLKGEIRPFTNRREANRRLRVGYFSPEFRVHCLALFTSALMPHQNHDEFEIFCYSDVTAPDAATARLKAHADVWRDTASLSDQQLAELIRSDQIDVLVDHAMHMRLCRPLLFARKPAPVQACWLAYPGTTGLAEMDYRLTDPYLDPPGFDERYTERSIRFAETFWCYEPRGMCKSDTELLPEPSELPAIKNGFVTFGCLNDIAKFNDATLRRWAGLMRAVPGSRLHLLARRGQCRDWMARTLGEAGIAAERIEFIDRRPRPAYLAEYRRIDLCVDTLSYNGHTTSLDSFWMGVPVLTQIGRTLVGRAGFSQLSNLKLPEFCAQTEEEFLELGKRWSEDFSGLREIRRTLRERMAASPLMDAKDFARRMEAAFRAMWREWIARQSER